MTSAIQSGQDENINPLQPLHWRRSWELLLCLFALTLSLTTCLQAQTFEPIPALSFTQPYEGANPLPQVLTIASTGANISFSVSATSTTGGNWLSINLGTGCCYTTPQAIIVSAKPAATLAAGTYTGSIAVKSDGGALTQTIPVSLTIKASGTSFFDDLAGGLTFSMLTQGTAPPVQTFQIRNAGTGTLDWTASTSTSDGGSWLTLSAASGVAPGYLSVGVKTGKLPGAGLTAGTFTGQVLLKTTGDSVTVPITVTVGASIFRQVNPLNFTKEYAGANPLPQVFTLASTGTNFSYYINTQNSTGGSWLTIDRGTGCCYSTPDSITVTVNPAITLVAGTYSAEIIAEESGGANDAVVVPVTFTVEPSSATFFDATPGEYTFSLATDGTAPPTQALQIRNAGEGTLDWTLGGSTADGGAWLAVSATSGTAPSTVNIGIVPTDLPGNGLVAGTFTGQIILQAGQDRVTIPITVTVGAAVFRQVNPLNFTMPFAGADPLPQVIALVSTGANFSYTINTQNSTGGSWLTINRGTGCCYTTPDAITVTAKPAVTLAAGTYSAEIIAQEDGGGQQGIVIPVTLTIEPPTATFFDALPGQLTFSMATGGKTPPAQSLQIRNAGEGTLDWTAATNTSDGGSWLTLSAASGTAPAYLNISVNPAKLPGGGLTAGNFSGEVSLETAGDTVTIPVAVTVGAAVFLQANALNFTMPFAGAHPLPQVITLASTGANFSYIVNTQNSTGGSWLSINRGTGCCYTTSDSITVTVSPAVTLAAGTYSAEIIAQEDGGGQQGMVIPVTLTIEPSSKPFFDTLPGEVTFSMTANGSAPPSQTFQVRNAGAGTLDWTETASTSDGGKWLTATPTSGSAPASLTVSINKAKLPGGGLVAGVFSGQIVLQTGTDRVTIPIAVAVGPAVFSQLPMVNFTKNYDGSNPATQSITIASTGAAISYTILAANSTGGAWLSISAGTGCCYTTPAAVTLTADPASTLAAGVYTAEIIVTEDGGAAESMLIPVTLTVNTSSKTATPVFTPPGGSYSSAQSVTITSGTRDAAIYYTTDGSNPTTASTVYTGPIFVDDTETLKAIAISPGYAESAIATAVYTFTTPVAATPAVSQTITITEATEGATVYYTTDGSTPTPASKKYTGPLTLTSSMMLKFIAVAPGYSESAVRTVTDTVQ